MRIHVLSDLHIEFGEFQYPEVDADLTILAGDVHVKRNGLKWILDAIPDRPVIYIMGNHEFYGEKLPRLTQKLKDQAKGTNVHILENDSFEFDGFRFFGATLWTDMNLHGDTMVGSIEAQQTMNDYKRIRHTPSYRKLRPVDTRTEHLNSVTHLRKFLESGEPKKSIVVTHHAPSILSLPERRRERIISCAYTSNLDDLIKQQGPSLWIHGHIHRSNDYKIGDTRIISNPRAYIDSPNPNFDQGLVIDLNRLS